MADEGWTIEVKCPHGVTHRGPVGSLRGFLPLVDQCETAQIERARQPQRLTWKDRRKWKRLAKTLGSIAPNAEPPPSSGTKEQR